MSHTILIAFDVLEFWILFPSFANEAPLINPTKGVNHFKSKGDYSGIKNPSSISDKRNDRNGKYNQNQSRIYSKVGWNNCSGMI